MRTSSCATPRTCDAPQLLCPRSPRRNARHRVRQHAGPAADRVHCAPTWLLQPVRRGHTDVSGGHPASPVAGPPTCTRVCTFAEPTPRCRELGGLGHACRKPLSRSIPTHRTVPRPRYLRAPPPAGRRRRQAAALQRGRHAPACGCRGAVRGRGHPGRAAVVLSGGSERLAWERRRVSAAGPPARRCRWPVAVGSVRVLGHLALGYPGCCSPYPTALPGRSSTACGLRPGLAWGSRSDAGSRRWSPEQAPSHPRSARPPRAVVVELVTPGGNGWPNCVPAEEARRRSRTAVSSRRARATSCLSAVQVALHLRTKQPSIARDPPGQSGVVGRAVLFVLGMLRHGEAGSCMHDGLVLMELVRLPGCRSLR